MRIDDAATSDYNDTKGYFWVRAVRTTPINRYSPHRRGLILTSFGKYVQAVGTKKRW